MPDTTLDAGLSVAAHASEADFAAADLRPQTPLHLNVAQTTNRHRNNPYESWLARYYDRMISVPPVGKIRRNEERTLSELFDRTLRPADHVLEIGPGTGRYTVDLARRVTHITAVEQSAEMVEQLGRRLRRERVTNCTVFLGDFAQTVLRGQFDVVALIGVLDYVCDPEPFLRQAAELTHRALLFTTPYCGVLARVHRGCNKVRGIQVSNYTPGQIRSYLADFRVEVRETGRCTRLCKGLTLACRATRF